MSLSLNHGYNRSYGALFLIIGTKYRAHLGENKIAVVCSARSTDTKAEGTTNR